MLPVWKDEYKDAWVCSASCGAWLQITLKHHALDESFALNVRTASQVLKSLKQVSRLVVNLEQVLVASSSGLALLVEFFQAMPPGSRLYILKANAEISQLLQDTGLEQLFPVVDHVSELPQQGWNE